MAMSVASAGTARSNQLIKLAKTMLSHFANIVNQLPQTSSAVERALVRMARDRKSNSDDSGSDSSGGSREDAQSQLESFDFEAEPAGTDTQNANANANAMQKSHSLPNAIVFCFESIIDGVQVEFARQKFF